MPVLLRLFLEVFVTIVLFVAAFLAAGFLVAILLGEAVFFGIALRILLLLGFDSTRFKV